MPNDKVYAAVNAPVLSCVPRAARRVLDVGCGTGAFASELKRRQPVEIVGITYSHAEATLARAAMEAVEIRDLNSFDFSGIGKFDCAVLSHVLEHLYDPRGVLVRLREALTPQATVVIALPNVLMWRQRLQFLLGRFRYDNYGLMDRTHVHFFDSLTAAELISDSGYELLRRGDVGHFPQPIFRRLMPAISRTVDRSATHMFPGLFADQFILIARTLAV